MKKVDAQQILRDLRGVTILDSYPTRVTPTEAKTLKIQARQVEIAGLENGKLKVVADGVAMEIAMPGEAALAPTFNVMAGHVTVDGAKGTMTAENDVQIHFLHNERSLLRIAADKAIINRNQITAPAANAK